MVRSKGVCDLHHITELLGKSCLVLTRDSLQTLTILLVSIPISIPAPPSHQVRLQGYGLYCKETAKNCGIAIAIVVALSNKDLSNQEGGSGTCHLFNEAPMACDIIYETHNKQSRYSVCLYECVCPPQGCGGMVNIFIGSSAFGDDEANEIHLCEVQVV